ncbi:MAG: DUF4336 domain-containing protein [Candidatus Cybelea sp.]
MTAIRLESGGLLLHSPCQPSDGLIASIARTGDVSDIVAPNWFHDLYLAQYRRLYPNATFWAPALLRRQHPSLIDRVLDATARPPWLDEMPHLTLSGLLTFNESLFYHRPSQTLVVADLLINASAAPNSSPLTKLGYRFLGLDGSVKVFPILRSFGLLERPALRVAARWILDQNPERCIVAHGTPIRAHAAAALREAFRWLG